MIDRIDPEFVQDFIDAGNMHVWRVPDTTTTVVAVTLPNGYTVVGSSACISPDMYDEQTGIDIAVAEISDKVWDLLGYSAVESNFKEACDAIR